jgi:hypothetical protein
LNRAVVTCKPKKMQVTTQKNADRESKKCRSKKCRSKKCRSQIKKTQIDPARDRRLTMAIIQPATPIERLQELHDATTKHATGATAARDEAYIGRIRAKTAQETIVDATLYVNETRDAILAGHLSDETVTELHRHIELSLNTADVHVTARDHAIDYMHDWAAHAVANADHTAVLLDTALEIVSRQHDHELANGALSFRDRIQAYRLLGMIVDHAITANTAAEEARGYSSNAPARGNTRRKGISERLADRARHQKPQDEPEPKIGT